MTTSRNSGSASVRTLPKSTVIAFAPPTYALTPVPAVGRRDDVVAQSRRAARSVSAACGAVVG